MECNDLLLEKEGHVAVMTLNRPNKLNALSEEMREFLPLAIKEVQEDDNMRALIITGAGRGFCSGADVSVQAARAADPQIVPSRRELVNLVGDFVLAFEDINKPVIAGFCCEYQRRGAKHIAGVHIGSASQKLLSHPRVTSLQRDRQCGASASSGMVGISPGRQQETDNVPIASHGGVKQRCCTVDIDLVNLIDPDFTQGLLHRV